MKMQQANYFPRGVKETSYIMVVFGHQWASTILFLLYFQISYCLEFCNSVMA